MKGMFRAGPRLLLLVSVCLHGCATKNPDWLTAPTGAFCASGLNDKCLKALAEKAYADATAKHVAAQAAEKAHEAEMAAKGATDSINSQEAGSEAPQLVKSNDAGGAEGVDAVKPEGTPVATKADSREVQSKNATNPLDHAEKVGISNGINTNASPDQSIEMTPPPNSDGSISTLAFGIAAIGAIAAGADGYLPSEKVIQSKEAGAILNVGTGPVPDSLLEKAGKITDKELRVDALSGLLSLHSRSMSEDQINTVLNELYALDKGQYANALIVKLPGLLKIGDLERARALRDLLLSSKASTDRPFSMLAFVASCYTMSGMKQDAGAIVQDFFQDGGELSVDDQKLIGLSISVSNGSYPLMQDFYDFKSDDARLSAYLTIAVIARQLDNTSVAHQAVADAVKFIQKAAVKIDRTKALSQILAVSPGVI